MENYQAAGFSTEDEYRTFLHEFYDIFDQIEKLKKQQSSMVGRVHKVMDRGYCPIIWEVITERQKKRETL